MTRGDLIFFVSRKLGLDDSAGSDELTLMQNWANRAVLDFLRRTHYIIKIGDMALQVGVAEYRLDSSILAIDDGRGSTPAGIGHYKLISLSEMIDYQSTQVIYASYRKLVSIEGNMLIVHPVPDTDEEMLRFYYVPRPTEMTDDANDPSSETYGGIPDELHEALEYYMLWQGAEYDDKGAALKPQDYFQIYLGFCSQARQSRWKMRGRWLLPARVGYPDAHRVPKRNDVYPA